MSRAQSLRRANQDLFSIFAYAVSGADTSPSLGLRNSYDPFHHALWGGKITLTAKVFSYLKAPGRVPCCAAANTA